MSVLDRIVRDLIRSPRRIPVSADAEPGLYAWWATPDRLADARPAIPLITAGVGGWALLYVGIAPNSPKSRRLMSNRIAHDHTRGTIGNSTFRQSLAALLRDYLRLEPMPGYDRSRLRNEGALTSWMNANCGLTWAVQPAPWEWEERTIAFLLPPLSIRPGANPFRFEVSAARARLRRDCDL